jgi:hypothetical protein
VLEDFDREREQTGDNANGFVLWYSGAGQELGKVKSLCQNVAQRNTDGPRPAPSIGNGLVGQPHTSWAVSTTRRSLATCSSKVRLLPSTVEENPHWGERHN